MPQSPASPKWAVQAPDGKVIQFPDNFSEQDVNREMLKMYPQKAQADPMTQMPGAIGAISRFGNWVQGKSPWYQDSDPLTAKMKQSVSPANIASNLYQGAKGAITALPKMAEDAYQRFPESIFGKDTTYQRFIDNPTDEMSAKADKAKTLSEKAGYTAAAAVPGLGPWAGSMGEQAGTGDIGGAAAQLVGGDLGAKVGPAITKRVGKVGELVKTRSALSSAIDEADGFTRKAKTLNVIDKTAQQVFNKTQEQFSLLKGKLIADAQKSIQPLIDADKQAGAKPIISTKAAVDAAQAMAKTDYTPTKLEQGLLDKLSESPEDNIARQLGYDSAEEAKGAVGSVVFDDFLKKGAGGVSTKGLDLESTLKLRTAIGRAMTRAKDPGGRMVLTTAYQGMTDTLNDRFNDIQGKEAGSENKAFAQYNQNHQAAFQIEDPSSFTSKFMDTPLDHHQARELLGGDDKGFIGANLTQITKQMADKGMNPNDLLRLQEDARRVVSAHDSIMGRYNKSLFRMLSSGDAAQAAMPLGVYALTKGAGLYGFVPYFAASLSGRIPAEMSAMTRFAETMKRLGVPDKAINTRVQPGEFVPSTVPVEGQYMESSEAPQRITMGELPGGTQKALPPAQQGALPAGQYEMGGRAISRPGGIKLGGETPSRVRTTPPPVQYPQLPERGTGGTVTPDKTPSGPVSKWTRSQGEIRESSETAKTAEEGEVAAKQRQAQRIKEAKKKK